MALQPFRLPHEYRAIDASIRQETLHLAAADGAPLGARLYLPARGEPDTALLVMHPRGDFARHYLAPLAAGAGYALLGANSRYLGNDADALHERLCLDVAGAVGWLRDRGFAQVVLVGNSGGGSLFALYLQQASLAPAARPAAAPSGDRVPLSRFDLPAADGLVLLAAHLGEGRFLLERLDPSLVDESDPTAADPRLDMYDPRNGYRPLEEGPSRYPRDFVAEFRAAQRARCERLDAQALAWCEEAAWFRARLAGEGTRLSGAERAFALRRALQRRYRVIYRTLADPRYLDPTLDPSERLLGSIFSLGQDPIKGNYGEGLARVMSARGWLSTWSGLRSRAELLRTLPDVRVPTLVVHARADQEIHPAEARAALAALAAEDKALAEVPRADHYFRPLPGSEGDDPLARMWGEVLLPWLRERWPV
jgi:alpha-beta hydrolase superfamily lysophospholipase